MTAPTCNIHATAIVLGTAGFLITGPSGSGKSALALSCISETRRRGHFAALVADDRVDLSLESDRIIARCPPTIQGLLEIRSGGIVAAETVPACVLDWAITPVRPSSDQRLPPESEELQLNVGRSLPLLRVPVENLVSPLDALHALLPKNLAL